MNNPGSPQSRSKKIISSLLSPGPADLSWQSAMALFSAILLVLSFPGHSKSYLAWVGLAPLLAVIARGVSVRRAFWLGWLMGLVFTFFAENWIAHSMTHYGDLLAAAAYLVAFLFASVLALFPALFAVAMSILVGRMGRPAIAFVPAVWAASEWIRPMVTGVTWNALGVTQVGQYPIARLSQYGGVYIVSALVASMSAVIVLSLNLRERASARAAALLLLLGMAGVGLPLVQGETRTLGPAMVTAVGVQPNLPVNASDTNDSSAQSLDEMFRLTRDAIDRTPEKSADLVVWAESPLVLFYENDPVLRQKLDRFAAETGSYLIVNTVTRLGSSYFNSINAIGPNEPPPNQPEHLKLRRYDKIRLVPFGEYVPWRPLLGRIVPAIVGDFAAGRDTVVNQLRLETRRAAVISGTQLAPREGIERTTSFVRVGAFICYESAYPELVRRFVRNGATLLVNVSNDAWFGNTSGAAQHLDHARMRAIENDRDILRVTNSGISALITADGQVTDPLPSFSPASHAWQAQLNRRLTFYTANGDLFAAACAALSALLLLFCLAARLRPAILSRIQASKS